MKKEQATKLTEEIKRNIGGASTIDIRQLSAEEWGSTFLKFLAKRGYGLHRRDVVSIFEIRKEENVYFIVITNWSKSRPESYYLVVYNKKNAKKILCEIHKYDEEHVFWRYNPTKRDKRNKERKKQFFEMYGSAEVCISLPSSTVSVDEFLLDIIRVGEIRKKADDLEISDYEDNSFPEGKHIERLHKTRERSSRAVKEAKRRYAKKHNGKMPCEVCGFDFSKIYRDRGKYFIEAHHKIPLGELRKNQTLETKVEDLAMVCSNCHRMLHRSPSLTVDELRKCINAADARSSAAGLQRRQNR